LAIPSYSKRDLIHLCLDSLRSIRRSARPEGQGTLHLQNIGNRGNNHPDALAELGRRADRAHHLSAEIFFLPRSPVRTTPEAPAVSQPRFANTIFVLFTSPPPVQDYLGGVTPRIVSRQPHIISTMRSFLGMARSSSTSQLGCPAYARPEVLGCGVYLVILFTLS